MKLLEQVRQVARVKHLAYRTEQAYAYWIERFIRFHGIRHPDTMGAAEVEAFLTDLAVTGHVAASTQNQALGALLFLYRDVLKIDIGMLNAVRARRPKRVPTVLSQGEVTQLLAALDQLPTTEPYGLMARLMYGAGLRLMECCRLRVKDIDLARGQLTIREGKGDKDRFVMLPAATREGLQKQLEWRRGLHEKDVSRGLGRVDMPSALERKFPAANHRCRAGSRLPNGRQFEHVPMMRCRDRTINRQGKGDTSEYVDSAGRSLPYLASTDSSLPSGVFARRISRQALACGSVLSTVWHWGGTVGECPAADGSFRSGWRSACGGTTFLPART